MTWRARLLQPWVPAAAFLGWYFLHLQAQWQPDSFQLYLRCQKIVGWLAGRSGTLGEIESYPIFQYISGVAAVWATSRGLPVNVFWIWAACNTVAFAGIIYLLFTTATRNGQPAVAWMMAAVVSSGFAVQYEPTTTNELVAAFLILWFTKLVFDSGSGVPCMILFVASGMTKEVAPLILLLIWIGAVMIRGEPDVASFENERNHRAGVSARNRRIFSALPWMLAGLLLTETINVGFNLFRFHSIWNLHYLMPSHLVRPWPRRLDYCVALWLSPNGGLLEFWPAWVLFVAAVSVLAIRNRRPAGVLLVVAILTMLTLGLSGWFAPFGWSSWGPRLMLPWLAACMMILLRVYSAECGRVVERAVRSPIAFAGVSVGMALLAIPHVMAIGEPDSVWSFFAPDRAFPTGASEYDADQTYAQNHYLAWRKWPPILAMPFMEDDLKAQWPVAACYGASVAMLLWECRRRSLDQSAIK